MVGAFTRLTWSFRDQAAGWTESWIVQGLLTQDQASQQLNGYLYVRMPLMGNGILADYARASYLDGSGISFKFFPNITTTPNGGAVTTLNGTVLSGPSSAIAPIYNGSPDRPYSTLFHTFFTSTGQSKIIYCSGIPDDVVTDPIGPTFVPGYLNGIKAWRLYVINNHYGWLTRKGSAPAPKSPIVAVTVGNPGSVNAPTSTLAPGAVAQVGGFRGRTGYRGRFTVLTNAGGVITLAGYNPPATLSGGNGYIQAVSYSFNQAASAQTPRETHRSRGKGSLVPVGRRKARRN